MASDRPGGAPTEQPTPKRLREARDKGKVARSQELTAALGFGAASGVLMWGGTALWHQLQVSTRFGIWSAATAHDPTAVVAASASGAVDTVLAVSLPVVFAAAAVGGLAAYMQVGALFTTKPITPELARINPVEGVKRLVSTKTWVELAKSIVKIALVGYLAYDLLEARAPDVSRLVGAEPANAFAWTASVAGSLLFRVVMCYAVIGVVDLLWQRHVTMKDMMMTREEVVRDHKEQEGDPQHKAERQRLHRDMLQHQMVEAVRTADAVIVNPDHIAVAIRYDEAIMDAPTVVATGERLVAQQIKAAAREHGVPVYRDVPMARALADLELDAQIPRELYEAVAAVLQFVYEQRGAEPR